MFPSNPLEINQPLKAIVKNCPGGQLSNISIVSDSEKSKKKFQQHDLDCYIYNPENFEPENYPGCIAAHPDSTRWLLNCIYFRHHTLNLDSESYVNLHNSLLAKIMGKAEHIKSLRIALVANGIIECDDHYIPGVKSLGYRLAPRFRPSVKVWKRYYGLGVVFKKRFERYKTEVNNPSGYTLPTHYHLEKWLNRITLDPEYSNCFEAIDIASKCQRAAHQAESLQRGFIYRKVCPYNRYHTNYSGLCRELRHYLRFENQPLHEIDIVNSQPYFLSVLLCEIFLSQSSSNCSNLCNLLFNSLSDSLPKKQREEEKKRKDHMISFFYSLDIPEDLIRMMKTTTEGTFYETLQDSKQYDRDKLKKRVFGYLYGDLTVMENASIGCQFETLYPTAAKIIHRLKKEKGHCWLGQELQRREAEIVINRVAGMVMEADPQATSIPIITIHDSILTTAEHVKTIECFIRQALSERNYIVPKLKIKRQ